VGWAPGKGPDTLARHATAQLPQHASPIHATTAAYVALRYADQVPPEQHARHGSALRTLIARFRP